MSEQLIKIATCENKLKKNDNSVYVSVNGKYTAFDEPMITQLRESQGKTVKLEIVTSADGKYHNIRGFLGESKEEAVETVDFTGKPAIAKAVIKQDEELTLIRDKPNSRSYGLGKDGIKIYFSDAEDLMKQLEELEGKGLMPKDWKAVVEEKKT